MTYQEAIHWIRQEAALTGTTPRQLIKQILVGYVCRQKAIAAKVVPLHKGER